jgi:hypothetical protein
MLDILHSAGAGAPYQMLLDQSVSCYVRQNNGPVRMDDVSTGSRLHRPASGGGAAQTKARADERGH